MESDTEFQGLLARVRQGEQEAATELVRNYEPMVRRFIRFRLSSSNLRRNFDSLDICQSVMYRFFVEVADGELKLDDPSQLKALLMTMARNRLYDCVRHVHAECRDVRRLSQGGDEAMVEVAAPGQSPSEAVSANEVLELLREHLTVQDLHLLEQRSAGKEWGDLAREMGLSPDAIRKRVTRAINDAAERMGFREP